MRYLLLTGILLFSAIQGVFSQNSRHIRTIDSIVAIIEKMPVDTLRLEYADNMFQRYRAYEGADRLIDINLQDARMLKEKKRETRIWYNYFRHAYFVLDRVEVRRCIDSLRVVSYENKRFTKYFTAYKFYLEMISAAGNYEQALQEGRAMEKEARQLDSAEGVFNALIGQGNAYRFSKKYVEAIAMFQQALKLPGIPEKMRLSPYTLLIASYHSLRDADNALHYLQLQDELIHRLIDGDSGDVENYKNRLLRIQLSYAQVYLLREDWTQMHLHLKNAEKLWEEDTFSSFSVLYHELWSIYHARTGEWERSLTRIDQALGKLTKVKMPLHHLSLFRRKADYLMGAGCEKEGVALYRELLLRTDSLRNELLAKQEEVLKNNYLIEQTLLDSEQQKTHKTLTFIFFGVVMLLHIVYFASRLYILRKRLHETRIRIREEKRVAEEADRAKEQFLKKVGNEIRVPLSGVLRFSKELVENNTHLPQAEKDIYKSQIDRDSAHLMRIINNVLDLSRLEAGKAVFDKKSHSLSSLCMIAGYESMAQTGQAVTFLNAEEEPEVKIETDATRFSGFLSRVFASGCTCENSYSIRTVCDNASVRLTVRKPFEGDPACADHLQHEFNKLFIELSGGRYRASVSSGEERIEIDLPVQEEYYE